MVLATALVAAVARVMPAKAQWTNGCEYGITNGLLTIGGADCGIAVPGHMIDGTGNSLDDNSDGNVGSFTDTRKEDRQDRLLDRRDQHKTKSTRNNRQRQERNQRRQDRKILCEDFSSQFAAVEAMAQNPWAAKKLDPNGNGVPCEHLRALTCDEFDDAADATNWFNRMGYSATFDPFKLFDAETGGVCTVRGLCGDFRNQKEAVEWITNHPKDAAKLDPDGDGAPCANLSAVTCKSFSSQDEAKQWFNRNGFNIATKDPYKLYDPETNSICPTRATCSDFDSQKEAVEWLTDNPVDRQRLDPDNDGAPCQKLPAVTCDEFDSMEEAGNWFDNNGFTPAKDPYNLYDATSAEVCPELACGRFTTQKAAIDWLTDHPEYQKVLDPNNDGLACTHLTTVRCNQFDSSAEVHKWHERNSITGDPYGLFDATANPQRYCSGLPLTTNG